MLNYSPPPWKFVSTEHGDEKVVMDEGHEVFIGNIEDTCDRCYANAHLIEQAPVMYDLLRRIHLLAPLDKTYMTEIDRIIQAVECKDVY